MTIMNKNGFAISQNEKEEVIKLIRDFISAYRKTPKSFRNKDFCPQNKTMFNCYSKLYSYVRVHAAYNSFYEQLYSLGFDKTNCYNYVSNFYNTITNVVILPKWNEKNILYVYRNNNSCLGGRHSFINATAVLLGFKNKNIELNVQYCPQCRKFYIEETSYLRYRKRYGAIIGNIKLESSGKYNDQDNLAEQSPLMLCGYTVNQQVGHSDSMRHYIISRIIDKGILSKKRIIDYLQLFIKKNGKKEGNELALGKWEKDLDFTLQYNIDRQPVVGITDIRRYEKKSKKKKK